MCGLTLLLCFFELIFSQVSADLAAEAIIGGHYAKQDDFKYQVALESYGHHFCGGTVIADQYILTGAHCVTDENGHINKYPIRVIAGTHDLKKKRPAVIEAVEIIYVHKEFNHRTYKNDIAILKLRKGLNLQSHHKTIKMINLVSGLSDLTGVTAVVSGFGYQSIKVHVNHAEQWVEELDGTTDGKLKFAEARIISNKHCAELSKPEPILPTNICGKVIPQNNHPNHQGVCTGDSGGPLVHRGEVVGILSKGPLACDETTKAAIYTRVSSYLDLIHNVITGHPGNDVVSARIPIKKFAGTICNPC